MSRSASPLSPMSSPVPRAINVTRNLSATNPVERRRGGRDRLRDRSALSALLQRRSLHCGGRRQAGRGRVRSVPVDVVCGPLGGVSRAEVGAVAAGDLDPLAAGIVDGLGDEVGDVVVTAPGHADVRRRGSGRLTEREVRRVDGLALSSVGGGGEGELDVLVDVVGRERTMSGAAGDEQAAVLADPGGPRSLRVV